MLILRQGLLRSYAFKLPKISLHFEFPKLFDIQFNKVEDYRAKLPLHPNIVVREWSASHESDFLSGLPERRRRRGQGPRNDLHRLCHFRMTFHDGYLDVLAEDFVFIMVSK